MAFFLMLLLMVMLTVAWSYGPATTTDKVAVTEMLFEINIKYQQPSTQHKTHIAHTRHMKLASYMLHNVLTHCFIWLVDNKYYSRQRMNIKRVNNFTMSLIQMVCLSASRIAYISLIWSDAPGCRTTYNVQRTTWPYETQGIYDNDAIFVWWWMVGGNLTGDRWHWLRTSLQQCSVCVRKQHAFSSILQNFIVTKSAQLLMHAHSTFVPVPLHVKHASKIKDL